MIYFGTNSGAQLKAIMVEQGVLGLHRRFGLISESNLADRVRAKKRVGFSWQDQEGRDWEWRVQIENGTPTALSGCDVVEEDSSRWKLKSRLGEYVFSRAPLGETLAETYEEPIEKNRWVGVCVLLAVGVALFSHFRSGPIVEEAEQEKPPVIVKLAPQKDVVSIPKELLKVLPESAKTDQKARRAVKQNLGFLGLIGDRRLKKAVGGVPTKLKDASPGAGEGGKEGSGGEYLTGLGEGVKRITVGNTGVKGLGGIGTKGRGGGAGGYGDRLVASGAGKGLSAIALSNDVVLDGGLDRNVIQATIAKYLNQVRACYEQGLERKPGIEGVVAVNFEVGAKGFLNAARVSRSTLGSSFVENCIVKRMLKWAFPKPVGGVTVKVNYPFLLRPVRG